ncbi:HlyD family type I secretion periplasmic adaptor subunit [Noviherbaspirillum sp.]|uniref:HlyD family type I secretion periplasmic adaptor subunit n=1 Tax=Noviherbaspirillum sp. TaxID=1926288 RepID=UPI002FE1D31F
MNTDATSHSRFGWLIVLFGVGGFMLWAMLAPLDQGIPVSGTVTVASNRKAVQHQTGGTVEEILVKEGDTVKAGQVLVRMNDIQAKSAAEMSRVQYFTARAAEARLIAERDGKKTIAFPPDLESAKNDPRVANNISLQSQLFSSRQSALQSEISALDESIAGLKSQMRGLEESRDSKKLQMQFLKEQLEGMRDLAKEGYVARNRLLDLERTYAQLGGAISEDIGNIGRAQRQISELNLRRLQRQQEYQKEVRAQLSEVQKEAEALENRLKSQDFDLGNTLVKAPVDGTIVGMNVFTKGGVVTSGFRLMDVVPSDDPLIIEGQVPVNLIDKVHPDLPVDLIFSAFNQNKTPHVPGVVTQVSADRFVDERNGAPYYKLKAKVTQEGMSILKDLQVRPGMPVEVFVKTGERTMMSYLFKPILDRAKTALTEE